MIRSVILISLSGTYMTSSPLLETSSWIYAYLTFIFIKACFLPTSLPLPMPFPFCPSALLLSHPLPLCPSPLLPPVPLSSLHLLLPFNSQSLPSSLPPPLHLHCLFSHSSPPFCRLCSLPLSIGVSLLVGSKDLLYWLKMEQLSYSIFAHTPEYFILPLSL